MLAIVAAALLAALPQSDTVFTADGGRVRGAVVEESAQVVTVQLLDGTTRRYEGRDVVRIEYADGTLSTRRPQPPPAAAPVVAAPAAAAAPQPTVIVVPCPAPTPPPPAPAPPPVVPAKPAAEPPSPFYLSAGLGALSMSGSVEKGVPASSVFRDQTQFLGEVGFRPSPSTGVGLYLDVGGGQPARALDSSGACASQLSGCVAATGRAGLLLRHTFDPLAPRTGWVAVGAGLAFGSVTTTGPQMGTNRLVEYTGWEPLRLMAGYDLRSNSVIGIGLYGGVGWSKYTQAKDATGLQVAIVDQTFHTTVEGGVRVILFP